MPQAIWSTDDVRHPRPGGFGDHVLRIRCERYTNQVNTNEDYLERMGLAQGTDRDSAAVRGIVSIWLPGSPLVRSWLGTIRIISVDSRLSSWGVFGRYWVGCCNVRLKITYLLDDVCENHRRPVMSDIAC